jgi:FkbM family methyltransferase
MMLRAIAERILRNRSLKRRLASGRHVYVSPDAQLKYLLPSFDKDLIRLAHDRANGDMVWDIGANCGVFAFSCIRAQRVIAVEPDPFLAHLLQKSVSINNSARVDVFTAAVSDRVGISEFSIAARGRASNHLSGVASRTTAGGHRSRFAVPTTTLDVMLDHFGSPDFVKIDVEGAELKVLQGAARLLSSVKPPIYIEVEGSSEIACRSILEGAGYRITGEYNWLAEPR